MMRPIVMGGALLALAACQTTDTTQYRQALVDNEVIADVRADPTVATNPHRPGDVELSEDDKKAARAAEYNLANIRPGERPALDSAEGGLWLEVDRVEERLRASPKLVEDEALVAYLKDVTCRIAGAYCPDIRVYVIDNPAFNASMMPNGVMQIHTGLLMRVHNEAQLAAIIGHEIGHYLKRHSMERLLDLRQRAATIAVLATLGGAPSGGGTATLNDGAVLSKAQRDLLPFGRDNEREADGYGLVLMTEAGYDPRQAATVWWNIQRESVALGIRQGAAASFNATHPTGRERFKVLSLLGQELYEDRKFHGKSMELGKERFAAAVQPIRQDLLENELSIGHFESSREAYAILLEEGNNAGEILFFLGELYRQRADEEKEDLARALKIYQRAAEFTDHPSELFRSRGLVHWKLGDKPAARADLAQYLTLEPAAPDAAMIATMLN